MQMCTFSKKERVYKFYPATIFINFTPDIAADSAKRTALENLFPFSDSSVQALIGKAERTRRGNR